MDAAARAASVAPETAMPQSAFFKSRRIVDAVAGHADDMAMFLQHLNDVKLVFREDLRKAIRVFNGLGLLRGRILLEVAQ
jgi:hypothetical protein